MPIKIFPSLMPGEPIETHEWAGTIGAWLDSKGIDYLAKDCQPITVSINGFMVPVSEWAEAGVKSTDDVEIRPLPNADPFTWAVAIIAVLAVAAVVIFMPKPRMANTRNTPQGRSLEVADGKANQPRLGEVVPELAGRHRRYPDYLTLPRRYFASLRDQRLEFLACVGPGSYQIPPDDVRIGESPFSALGGNAGYQIFGPGADLSGVTAHENWHTAPEVGGTSSGTAGLELSVDMATSYHTPAPAYVFSGLTISIPTGTGTFPVGWGPNTQVSILLKRVLDYAVTKTPIAPPLPEINVFTGNFAHLMPLANGDEISVVLPGVAEGQYLAQAVSIDGAGNGSLQLWTLPIPATESEPAIPSAPIAGVAIGNRTISFFRTINYTLTAADANFITVSAAMFPAITSAAEVAYSCGAVYGEWTSSFAACPPNEATNTIELDFFFPGGLARINDDGDLEGRGVSTEIQYRNMSVGGAYTSVMRNYSQATLDQIGFTQRLSVSPMRPEVRVRRVGATTTSTQVQDKVQWYGLKSRLPTRTSYPNWTTMAVDIRSGGKLAAQSENQINVIATRILPTLLPDGTWSAPQPTRDISAFTKYIASTIGYTDSNLDMGELRRLHGIWTGRGETVDYVFDQTTAKEALNVGFGAGMAELTIDDGLIKPVRDDVRTQFEQGYSPQNMTGPLRRTFKSRKIDDADGVEVEFINADTWAKDVVPCRLPGDQGFKVQKIKVDGVTSRTQAWRIGMRQRRMMRYRNWEYTFETELDALNSGYLSYVPLIDDIPGYGQSSILEQIEPVAGGAMLTVSEPMDWQAGKSHVVAYRKPDGTLAGPFTASKGVDDYSIIAAIPLPWPVVTLKMEPPHVYFGTAERWTFPALVTEIEPNGIERVRVSATNYDPRVYASDNETPPI